MGLRKSRGVSRKLRYIRSEKKRALELPSDNATEKGNRKILLSSLLRGGLATR